MGFFELDYRRASEDGKGSLGDARIAVRDVDRIRYPFNELDTQREPPLTDALTDEIEQLLIAVAALGSAEFPDQCVDGWRRLERGRIDQAAWDRAGA